MNNWRAVNEFVVYSTKGITPKYVKKSSVMVLNQKCVRDNNIDFSFAQYTDDSKPILNTKILKIGDILFNSTGQGTAGRCAFVNKLPADVKVITDSHMLLLRCGNYYEAKCLGYALYSFEEEIQTFMDGSTGQGELDKVRLFNIKVNLTKKLSVQKKISTVLSTLDAKIELNNRINSELEAMAKTLYDYWFVQFDFPISKEQAKAMGKPELVGKPYKSSGGKMVYNETLKREIPEEWRVKSLISFCVNIGDGIHGTPKYVKISDCSFINGNNLKNGFIQIAKETKKVSNYEYQNHYIELNKESILLSINGTIGNLAVHSGEKVMLGKSAAYINCKGNKKPYCYQYLKMETTQQMLWSIATGSTIKNLSLDSLKTLLLPMPDNKTTELFYYLLKPIDAKRQNIFQQNKKLSKLRDWLLPMLMNGQVTVK